MPEIIIGAAFILVCLVSAAIYYGIAELLALADMRRIGKLDRSSRGLDGGARGLKRDKSGS
jgi:hypothetical protein